jgi:acyl-CoA synthetase (AMP-forming)/AMP-acid ligase II
LPAEPAVAPETATTLAAWFPALTAAFGDDEAIVGEGRRLTYRSLDVEARRWARRLVELGVGKGSRVGLLLGNGPTWLVAFAAVTRLGGVAVPLSTFFTPAELAYVVRHADLQGWIVHGPFLGRDQTAEVAAALPGVGRGRGPRLFLDEAPFLRWVGVAGPVGAVPAWAVDLGTRHDDGADVHDTLDALDAIAAAVHPTVHPTDPALMIYTSGSTATPKGVPHTHGSVMTKVHHLREMFELERGVRSYIASPFFWVGGLTMSLFPVLDAGGVQLCTHRFDAGEALELIERERPSRAVLYPHHVAALVEHPAFEKTDRSSLRHTDPRLLADGVAPPPPPSHGLGIGIGMTETFGGYWWGRPDPPGSGPPPRPGERRPPPLDMLQPGVELKVVDPQGRPVADGERGEICIRGVCIMHGRHKEPREAAFDADGWFHTGDEGEVDGARVRFRGRLDETIKTAGANVAPAEVAAALCELAGVAEAYVVGLPDETRGRVVAAAVVPQEGAAVDAPTLRAELRTRLSAFKVPVHIVVMAAADIPWTASHKVRRGALTDLIAARLR